MSTPSKTILLGLSAGVFGGLFGVGGGIIMVPGLVMLVGLNQHQAHATSITAIVATGSAAVVQFATAGDVAWATAAWLLVGALVGVYFASRFMDRIPAVWLARGFFALVITAALRMWVA